MRASMQDRVAEPEPLDARRSNVSVAVREPTRSTKVNREDSTRIRREAPLRTLIAMTLAIFVVELAIMLIFNGEGRDPLHHLLVSLADSGLLVLVLYPVLHLTVYRPLLQEVLERKRAEDSLREAHDELDVRVHVRTAELAIANDELRTEIVRRVRVEETLQASFEAQRDALEGTIRAMASTIELRDPYTAGHQRRVAELAKAIAEDLGLPPERVTALYLAAVIHDIGKITVPAEILNKPGPISKIEFSLIKSHAQIGYDIVKTIAFPWPIAPIMLQHHERMDGSGYPLGLAGEDIRLEARILAVADVVEAMASHRPYRPALGVGKALAEISQQRGILYDLNVVQSCLRVFTEPGFQWLETDATGHQERDDLCPFLANQQQSERTACGKQ